MELDPLKGYAEAVKLYGHLGDSLAEKLYQLLQEMDVEALVECNPTVSKKNKKADLRTFYMALEIEEETYNTMLKDVTLYKKRPEKLLKEYWNVYPIISEDASKEKLYDVVKKIKESK